MALHASAPATAWASTIGTSWYIYICTVTRHCNIQWLSHILQFGERAAPSPGDGRDGSRLQSLAADRWRTGSAGRRDCQRARYQAFHEKMLLWSSIDSRYRFIISIFQRKVSLAELLQGEKYTGQSYIALGTRLQSFIDAFTNKSTTHLVTLSAYIMHVRI
jgi:hypothetical protein